ncbi:MAG: FtsX-like permease family protein [Gracilibacteraceae bacterium]|jgi:putative ABC transport system permease protein|nr:FtsX-like permease family protein [Gracilibacteraceae bacterium]
MADRPYLTFSDLALCNLKRRPFRAAGLILLVALMSFVLFGGSLIAYSLFNGTDALGKRLGADILIVPKGYDQKVEGILLRGEPGTFYMDAAWLDKIAAVEGVRAVSPQLFVASLNASCCAMPVQLIGFEQKTDFVIEPWLKTAHPGGLADEDIIVGGAIAGKVGDTIKFFDRDYRIAAKMERTGTGFDASVFMNMTAAKTAAADYGAAGGTPPPDAAAISSLMVMVDEGYTPSGVTGRINSEFGYGGSGIVVVAAKTIINSVSGGLRAIVAFAGALDALLWVLSLLVLSVVFSVVLNERKREFGILRSLGATRRRLVSIVFLESGLVSLAGSTAGVFLAALLILPFRAYIQDIAGMPYMQPSPGQFAGLTAASLLLAFAVGPLASLFSAGKISRGDAYAAIREGEA